MRFFSCLGKLAGPALLVLVACSGPDSASHSPAAAPPAPAAPATTAQSAAAPVSSVTRQPLALTQLPAALRPQGRLLEAWRWPDANGENTLVVSRTVVADDAETEDGRTARLLARQYVRHGGSYRVLWQLQDAVEACPLDLTLGLLPGSTSVSDLDGNGRTETTLVYALACRGGVDPSYLKLIMREGAAKYALRGEAIELIGNPEEVARARRQAAGPTCCAADAVPDSLYWRNNGLYESEKDFAAAPPAFLAFAQQQWRKWRTRADENTEVQ